MQQPMDAPLTQTGFLFRRLCQTVTDIDEARPLERARSAHGKKPRNPLANEKGSGPGVTWHNAGVCSEQLLYRSLGICANTQD